MKSAIHDAFGIVCIIFAILLAGVGITKALFFEKIPITHESGLGVSLLVGGLLPAFLFAIIGALVRQKRNSGTNDENSESNKN